MHAEHIIQGFLTDHCPQIHAKRRACLARITGAARRGGLGVVRLGKQLGSDAKLKHRIKMCDRLISNPHLYAERVTIYRALAHRLLSGLRHVSILVDWSELHPDGGTQLLRAAVVLKGRAFTLLDEVHPQNQLGSAKVHRAFMETLRQLLPAGCDPVIVTDAGFRATWFKMLDQQGWAWIGRIRNRDMVRPCGNHAWVGCKSYYTKAKLTARNLGAHSYVKSNPVECRLVLVKNRHKGRHHKTKLGKITQSRHSKKNRAAQSEPWLLAVSPRLAGLRADKVVELYAGRMQIEQTFRDLKNQKWGMGLGSCSTRQIKRASILVLIATLLAYALWLIGLAMRLSGRDIGYGSRKKVATTLSVLSLATYWLGQPKPPEITQQAITVAHGALTSMVATLQI